MKLTIVLIALLSIATTWAEKERKPDDAKDKREAAVGYPSSSHGYQAPSLGNEGASAISIGAGYSVGGAKPSYSSYEGQGYTGSQSLSSEGLPASGHATIQLPPITLQPSHGNLVGSDLSQLMSQLQQGLDSGALTLQAPAGYGGFQSAGQSQHGGQEHSPVQFSYGAPKLQQYNVAAQSQPSVPSYASSSKGLGSYSSTGPVLFSPSDARVNTQTSNHASPIASHSFGASGGLSFGNAGHSFTGASSSTGGSHGGSGNSLSSPYKSFGNSYATSGKNAFKPSAYIGSSVQSDSSQGLSVISPSYGAPSFASAPSQSGGHAGLSLGADSHSGVSLGSSGYDGSLGNLGGFSLTSASLDGHSQNSAGSLSGHSLGSGGIGGHSVGSGGYGGHFLSSGSPGGNSLSSGSLGGHSLSSGSFGGHSLNSGSLGGNSLSDGSLGGQSLSSSGLGGHSLSSSSLSGHSLGSGSHGGLSFGSGDFSGQSLTSGSQGSHGGFSFASGGPGASFGGSHGGFGGGSTKYISNSYLPAKSDGFGSFSSYTAGLTAPPKTTYGHPSGSYLPANSAYSASSHTPQYYVSKSQPSYSSNFGAGSSSYRAPVSSQSSLKSYPKYSTGAAGGYSGLSAMYGAAKDLIEGAFSENSYNTIKYSQELKASS